MSMISTSTNKIDPSHYNSHNTTHANRYYDLYLKNSTDTGPSQQTNTFDPELYLYEYSDLLNVLIQEKNCYACLSEPLCTCIVNEQTNECDCDHEEHYLVQQCLFSLGSNCNFVVQIQLQEPLNQASKKSLQQELETCNVKLFSFEKKQEKDLPHQNLVSNSFIANPSEIPLLYLTRTPKHGEESMLESIFSHPEMCKTTFELSDAFSTRQSSFSFRINYMNFHSS
ncbi:MAG: hypothetical protein Sylvanvirus21_12 [Sylvanvirus sp.]|uniref:Uncharacterized protein n=1 Tax=Sylvanvirus sp. TaxID=2487774 RepID=A0A3G5AIQ1_9VIRU|nr:MAG: hypothetical protein Sylvanvirus21_12 [Sylvanvirus sp.]